MQYRNLKFFRCYKIAASLRLFLRLSIFLNFEIKYVTYSNVL